MAKKQAAVRKDPAPRPINTVNPHFDVINQRPDRDYKWVYKAATEFGVDYYRDVMGYEPVQYSEQGPRARVGRKYQPGEFIVSQGHLLMEAEKSRAEDIYENGIDGGSGQQLADLIEKKMLNSQKSTAELMQRIQKRSATGSDYFSLEAEKGSVCIPVGDTDG